LEDKGGNEFFRPFLKIGKIYFVEKRGGL